MWATKPRAGLTDDPAVTAKGRVHAVAAQADPVTVTFEVKAGLSDPPEAARASRFSSSMTM
jgi:hypothetical protein